MSNSTLGRIHSVETFGAVDGPGIRYVVFFQGCRLRCLYCHNPDSWDLFGGEEKSAEEVFKDICRYKNFIKKGGVTLSGGEPLMQIEFASELVDLCRGHGLHVALDTAGSVDLSVSREVIDKVNMVLLDIKTFDPVLSAKLTGKEATLDMALATLGYCETINKPIWIRHVIVPSYTLDENRLTKIAEYLSKFKCIERVDLLPFHKMGEYKWEVLHEPYQLSSTLAPTAEQMEMAYSIFKNHGLNVYK